MNLSQLAREIKESPTLKLNAVAARLREQGEPVIHLGGGEPKSKAPLGAVQKCVERLGSREVRYTPADGLPDLKKAVIRYTEQHYHKTVAAENVVVSGGAKQAIMDLLHAVIDPMDEVVFPAPYWVSYPDMVRIAGGVPVVVTPRDGSFRPTVAEIAAAVTARTKVVIINSPNNPSGVMYSRDFVAELVELCEAREIFLVTDDIYNRLVFDGQVAPNVYDFAKAELNSSRVVVIQGVSKSYAMTGFRIGWGIAAREVARAMANIQGHETSGPATPSQWAALAALDGAQDDVEGLRSTLEKHRDAMVAGLAVFRDLRFHKPEGTFYCFPDFSAYRKESQKLAEILLEKVRVVAVPGKEFGMEGHLRLSYCGSLKDVTDGLERIRWALDPTAPRELRIGDRTLVRD
jgi:aspartate aminotransferase